MNDRGRITYVAHNAFVSHDFFFIYRQNKQTQISKKKKRKIYLNIKKVIYVYYNPYAYV